MRDFLIKAGITLGLVGIQLAWVMCLINKQIELGILLMLGCLAVVGIVILILARSRISRNDEIDPISKSGRFARQAKNPPTKNVYENDADIWNRMTDDIPDR